MFQDRFAAQHFVDAIRDVDDRMRTLNEALLITCDLEAFWIFDILGWQHPNHNLGTYIDTYVIIICLH